MVSFILCVHNNKSVSFVPLLLGGPFTTVLYSLHCREMRIAVRRALYHYSWHYVTLPVIVPVVLWNGTRVQTSVNGEYGGDPEDFPPTQVEGILS